ncbi:MAG: phosphoribosylanthranilate isomerase [Dehalococcoidia bacterium]|jgi:phosphoribosylanthranilate isomerase|nr:phosphoribosylanthranilate isomerase [Dehalococcoidia bacterium]
MTKIKICGISKVGDALAAANAGADYLGILFDPHSRRHVDADEARSLVQSFRSQWHRDEPRWVGVFANQPLEEVNNLITFCNMDIAQLSGHESTDYCLQVVRPVFKVIHVRNDVPVQDVLEEVERSIKTYRDNDHMSMLDTFKDGVLGGTGQAFNWEVAQSLALDYPFLLAGGLSPENVAGAIRQVRPWGLDVSSGVETSGQKDAAKIAQFIAQVQQADEALIDTSRR